MKLVYTQENMYDVIAMRSYLDSCGIVSFLKNEFTSSVMGEIPFFETWPEIWVADEFYDQAKKLVDAAQNEMNNVDPAEDWHCRQCNELNPGNFELCWQCGAFVSNAETK